jgi:hypothetical protein
MDHAVADAIVVSAPRDQYPCTIDQNLTTIDFASLSHTDSSRANVSGTAGLQVTAAGWVATQAVLRRGLGERNDCTSLHIESRESHQYDIPVAPDESV